MAVRGTSGGITLRLCDNRLELPGRNAVRRGAALIEVMIKIKNKKREGFLRRPFPGSTFVRVDFGSRTKQALPTPTCSPVIENSSCDFTEDLTYNNIGVSKVSKVPT